MKIEDYGFIGNMLSCALVARDGSIDWLCLPRFDSGACFAALLGKAENGRWMIAPAAEVRRTRRRYRENCQIRSSRSAIRRAAQSGILPCFFRGSSSRLSRSMRNPSASRLRATRGAITSSMKPSSAAL